MALAGAVPPPAALTAANRVVKSKGRMSLRVAAKASPMAFRPAAVKSAARPSAAKAKFVAKPAAKAAAKPAAKPIVKAAKRKKAAAK